MLPPLPWGEGPWRWGDCRGEPGRRMRGCCAEGVPWELRLSTAKCPSHASGHGQLSKVRAPLWDKWLSCAGALLAHCALLCQFYKSPLPGGLTPLVPPAVPPAQVRIPLPRGWAETEHPAR